MRPKRYETRLEIRIKPEDYNALDTIAQGMREQSGEPVTVSDVARIAIKRLIRQVSGEK